MATTLASFDDRPLRTELERAGFHLATESVDLGGGCHIPLAAFSHRPFDTRTASFAAIPAGANELERVQQCSRFGAPLIGVGNGVKWRIYHLTQGGPQIWWDVERGPVSRFFKEHCDEIKPRAIFRAKTLAQLDRDSQLEFVDFASFRRIEEDAGKHLTRLIHEMVAATRGSLGWPSHLDERKAQWIARANFWLLAGRILHDKKVPGFIKGFDLAKIADVFSRVRKHYDDKTQPDELPNNRMKALQAAAKILAANPSLAIVSPETLADPFENALITRETRKESGTHSTPGWLVEYMLGRLRPWIEELAAAGRCRVFEPASGHAPFLLGAMRTLASLPCCEGMDDKARHDFFKRNLEGCEYDGFAREVARLSLTLADVPNPNGWNLGDESNGDLFFGDRLERGVKAADIVLCNPPFEADKTADSSGDDLSRVKKAAQILRRCAAVAKPGAVFGFVVPQTMLDSHKLVDLRGSLVRDFEWMEICRLSGKVFGKADVETALLLARKHPQDSRSSRLATFRHVWERREHLNEFRKTAQPTFEKAIPLAELAAPPQFNLLQPDLSELWNHLSHFPKLNAFVGVGRGFGFCSKKSSAFSKGQKQKLDREPKKAEANDYWEGYYGLEGAPNTHCELPLTWMNKNPAAISEKRAGLIVGVPQVVMNHIRVQRGPWRLKAWIDSTGRPTRGEFLVLRPRASERPWPHLFTWALINSPISHAYAYATSTRRHIYSGVIELLPVSTPTNGQIARIESAARAYREAAERWTKQHPQGGKAGPAKKESETDEQPDFFAAEQNAEQQQLLELKYLHWRMDAEVLSLYNLPAPLERQLLDYFTGEHRVGVPFEQKEYFPKDFKGMNRLSELLAITADWPKHSKRRAFLIKVEYDHGSLSAKDETELESLQRLASLRRNLVAPIDRSELDASNKRLKLLGQWSE
jgi:hypothetical protein